MTVEDVCARIASQALAVSSTADRDARCDDDRIGGFTLRPAQRRSLAALRASIDEFGGALLADPPGTGKTVLALAAARGAGRVLVTAPSNLRAQWSAAALRAEVAILFASLESLSRASSRVSADFVIVDEAHHLRTPATRRYSHVAAACVGARVLLLSATPVVNRTADRTALLALFMGARAERLSPSELGRCVVRRLDSGGARPLLRRIGAVDAHLEVDGIGDALRALPPPLPVRGGAPATALVAMSLAIAWQSSLAALDAVLRRRAQRGDAIADLLRAGREPSHAALRHWVLHDDATQLALPLLVADASASPASDGALATLQRHLAAVESLRSIVRPHRTADATRRAGALRALLSAHPGRRMVVFARHAETVRALGAALRSEPGVVTVIGARVRAASGRWTRDDVLRAIGPRAREIDRRDAPDARDPRAIRLVISTDALAEGVEMQGVGIVVHADLPWTPARLEQRIGRVIRMGSRSREVLEAWFSAPRGARGLVRLGARLATKARSRRAAVRDGGARGEIMSILERWADGGAGALERATTAMATAASTATTTATTTATATVTSDRDGFITVVDHVDGPRLISGVHDGTRWRVSSSPRRVLGVLRSVDRTCASGAGRAAHQPARGGPRAACVISERRVRLMLSRVIERRQAAELASPSATSGLGSADGRRVQRVRARFARLLERAPALARGALADRHQRLLGLLESPLEAARERRIDELLRADLDDAAFARRLGALMRDCLPRNGANEKGLRDAAGMARAAPLLLLRRASAPTAARAAAPTSASPGTAAPR